MISEYSRKLGPRISRADSPSPSTSEASQTPSLNAWQTPGERFRPSPDGWVPKPARQSSRSSGYSNAKSLDPPILARRFPLLTPTEDSSSQSSWEGLADDFAALVKKSKLGKEIEARIDGTGPKNPTLTFRNAQNSELESEWDFGLPVIPLPRSDLGPGLTQEHDTFNLRDLVGQMQNGAGLQMIQNYLARFDRAKIRKHINDEVDGFPAMFYVVETNNEEILKTWVAFGGDSTVKEQRYQIPLLAFAIMQSENIQADTTPMTATLLSLGASPDIIPSAFYSPYLQELPETGPSDESLKDLDDENKRWCKGAALVKLARSATLSQRYYLERAAKTKKPSVR